MVFIIFGYAIWFKGKYTLINNFISDREKGKLDDFYAERVGKIEFIGGISCVVLGIITMFLEDKFTLMFSIVCILFICTALIINLVKSTIHKN